MDQHELTGIDRRKVYPTSELRKVGLHGHALRQAYRQGLRRFLIGRKTFVTGEDVFKWLESRSEKGGNKDA